MKILLSAGHGGADSGSIGLDNGKEKDRTMDLVNLVANKLKNMGHTVTTKQEKNWLGWTSSNRNGYDYALSIHFNSFNSLATGTECFYKSKLGKASELSKAVANAMGIKNRGAKQTSELRMLNIGFDNLLEICFHDNSNDLSKYNTNKDAVATAIANAITGGKAVITTNTVAKPSNNSYKGNSLVDYLKSIGVDSSFTNRKKLAQTNGIKNYTGTASQNTALLNKLRGNKATTTTTSNTSYYARYYGYSGSLVDALKSLNIDSSFSNRSKIAKTNGVKVYLGTSNQNTTLLNLLKQGRLKK